MAEREALAPGPAEITHTSLAISLHSQQNSYKFRSGESSYSTRAILDACTDKSAAAVSISTSPLTRKPCETWCSCVCHQRTAISTSPIFTALLGTLFVGYSGQPSLKGRCNQSQCRSTGQKQIQFTYTFPRWFLARMVSVVLTSMPMGEPRAVIVVQRTVPNDAEVFHFTKLGNIDKLMNLFSSGLASPNDVHCVSGATALDASSLHIHYSLLKVLTFFLCSSLFPTIESMSSSS